jgi:hypothetical protein
VKRAFLAILLCTGAVHTNAAEKPPIPSEHIYGPLIGKRVTLDALVWPHTKGIAGRVVLPSGESVYVRAASERPPEAKSDPRLPNGKLVRLVGVLTFEQVPAAPPGAQGYSHGASYFSLALESFSVIERAEREFPELSPKK